MPGEESTQSLHASISNKNGVPMIRIGLVDLDTSHPGAFTRILRTMSGVEVTALWDGRDVWPE